MNRQSPFQIKEAAYEKQNRKMRKDYTSETGKKLGSRQTSGTGKRRVSFACRFAGMAGAMKDAKGEPTKKAMALKNGALVALQLLKVFVVKINLKNKYEINSPFRQDKCATGWAKMKEGYLKKKGGAEEYKKRENRISL